MRWPPSPGGRLRPPDCSVREEPVGHDGGLADHDRGSGALPALRGPPHRRRHGRTVARPGWPSVFAPSGLRPINNVVDVTNYVLWELGHPLHAFDGDLLTDRHVVIRRARPGEAVVTLDGQSRSLGDAMLVIADAARAVAVAGVMGGANSEVRDSTRTVLLESAYFAPGVDPADREGAGTLHRGLVPVRAGRGHRGAAGRAGPRRAADRRARRGPGRLRRARRVPAPRRPLAVPLRLDRIQRVVGACPPRPVVASILRGLGFPATEREGGFEVVVPAFRRDVAIEDDLVEEVARVWGYDKIPSTLPSGTLALTRRPRHMVAQDTVRRVLTAAGCQEAVSLSLIDPAHLRHLELSPDDPRVVAPPESARGGSVGAAPDAPLRAAGGARDQRAPPDAGRAALRDRPRVRGPRGRGPCPGRTRGSGSC